MLETQVWSLDQEDSPVESHGNSLQYSRMENSPDRGAWWATVWGLKELDMIEQLTHSHLI